MLIFSHLGNSLELVRVFRVLRDGSWEKTLKIYQSQYSKKIQKVCIRKCLFSYCRLFPSPGGPYFQLRTTTTRQFCLTSSYPLRGVFVCRIGPCVGQHFCLQRAVFSKFSILGSSAVKMHKLIHVTKTTRKETTSNTTVFWECWSISCNSWLFFLSPNQLPCKETR